MANITKVSKLEYRLKDVMTDGENFIDQYGEIVYMISELHKVFGSNPFDISVSQSQKESLVVEDFDE